MIELIRSSHSVTETNLHMQFTPAFRQDVFQDEDTRILVRDYMLAQSRRKGFEISAFGFGDDHLHVFVSKWKNFAPAKLAQLLKGYTSRMMRKLHWDLFRDKLYGDMFWSGGYFARTVGAVNAETVRKYVTESQDYSYAGSELKQRKLLEFAS
ncbi:MAG: IS200/IS605 family transposase [Candidatus Aenigmarchaeota archaeon]|nr:IS200/IS605 family transposase [Candidatus Aenigmarchaeota archaeon]